ncbi:MAG TPA: hypothetical protein VK203_26860, partial [Nostocaceae cyanobacterium]|nr:hypothetical protein [Nostocaceae cyanobacterium]
AGGQKRRGDAPDAGKETRGRSDAGTRRKKDKKILPSPCGDATRTPCLPSPCGDATRTPRLPSLLHPAAN